MRGFAHCFTHKVPVVINCDFSPEDLTIAVQRLYAARHGEERFFLAFLTFLSTLSIQGPFGRISVRFVRVNLR